jgi:hypothetical protein
MRTTGVLITMESAQIVRWSPGLIWRSRIVAPGPVGHGATRGSAARVASAGEHDEERRPHLFAQVIHVLSREDELLLLGDRDVVVAFAEAVHADDLARRRVRRTEVRQSGPLTDRQLVSRVRAFAGDPVRRRPKTGPRSTSGP